MVETVSIDDLKRSALELIGQITRGDFAGVADKFDDTMKNALPQETLQELWKQLIGQLGPIVKVNGVNTTEVQGYRDIIVACQFEKAGMDMHVLFNGQGRISGLNFTPAADSSAGGQYTPPFYVDPNA